MDLYDFYYCSYHEYVFFCVCASEKFYIYLTHAYSVRENINLRLHTLRFGLHMLFIAYPFTKVNEVNIVLK